MVKAQYKQTKLSANIRIRIRRRIITIPIEETIIRPIIRITTNIRHSLKKPPCSPYFYFTKPSRAPTSESELEDATLQAQ